MAEQQHLNEEQAKALQEKLKNMSPEELKEFQKKQCIFCQIIEGKIPSKKVYEDNDVIGILDINPASPGHVLILPKEHYSIMPQIPDDLINHIFRVVKIVSNAVLRGLEVKGTNVVVANGVAAGQKAQHFMVHVIPREEEDGIGFEIPQNNHSEKELAALQKKLAGSLGAVSSSPEEEKVVEADFEEKKSAKKAITEAATEEPDRRDTSSADLDSALAALSGEGSDEEEVDEDVEEDIDSEGEVSEDVVEEEPEDNVEDDSHEEASEYGDDDSETVEEEPEEEHVSEDDGDEHDDAVEEEDSDEEYDDEGVEEERDDDNSSSGSANLDDIARMFGAK